MPSKLVRLPALVLCAVVRSADVLVPVGLHRLALLLHFLQQLNFDRTQRRACAGCGARIHTSAFAFGFALSQSRAASTCELADVQCMHAWVCMRVFSRCNTMRGWAVLSLGFQVITSSAGIPRSVPAISRASKAEEARPCLRHIGCEAYGYSRTGTERHWLRSRVGCRHCIALARMPWRSSAVIRSPTSLCAEHGEC